MSTWRPAKNVQPFDKFEHPITRVPCVAIANPSETSPRTTAITFRRCDVNEPDAAVIVDPDTSIHVLECAR